MIKIENTFGGNKESSVIIGKFPAGESLVTVDLNSLNITIYWDYEGDHEFFELLLVVQALKQVNKHLSITLVVPYFPHSRMDRVMSKEVSFSLKTAIDIINSCNFKYVTTFDAHSSTIELLLKTTYCNVPQYTELGSFLKPEEQYTIVSPDVGASKKILGVAQTFDNISNIIYASKDRDILTGRITATRVNNVEVPDDNIILVVDDICDGGRTFIELGKVLKKEYPNHRLQLYVTHGIFSKGLTELEKYYEKVSCYNIVNQHNQPSFD